MTDSHNITGGRPPSAVAGATDTKGVCRIAHWRATWAAVIRSSRLEDPDDARAFLEAYSNGLYSDIDAALSRCTERMASALIRFTNNTLVDERAARAEALPKPPRKTRGGRTYNDFFPNDADEDGADASARPELLAEGHQEPSQASDVRQNTDQAASGPRWSRTEPLARPDESEEYDRATLEGFYVAWSSRLRVLDVMRRPAWSHQLSDSDMRRALFEIVGEVESLEDFLARFDEPEAT